MSYLIKGALPFGLALATGLMIAAALGHWQTREWTHHHRTGFVSMYDGGDRCRRRGSNSVRIYNDSASQPLLLESDHSGTLITGSAPVHVISYSLLSAVDGEAVTRDAVVTNLPTPRSWTNGNTAGSPQLNNIMLGVTLGASGRVTEVRVLPGSEGFSTGVGSSEFDLGEIMSAAHAIEFQPAMRNGRPVAQQINVIYRQQ